MRGNRCWQRLLFALLGATLAVNPVPAQNRKTVEARLRVTVVDQTGAAIPNARVTINTDGQSTFYTLEVPQGTQGLLQAGILFPTGKA